MAYKQLPAPTRFFDRDAYVLFDDFNEFVTADVWTSAVAGTGTVAHDGSVGRSHMELFNTAANDAAVLATTHEMFKFIASKAMYCEGRIIFTDVDTDDGMVAFGWADALAATTLADTTGAVTATDAALIYKLPDTTVWAFHTEINGSATATTSGTTAGGTAHQQLAIDIIPRSSTVFEARPFVDGVQLKDSSGNKIMHTITLGTATDLDFGVMTKSNDAADFSLFVDYLYAAQVRS
jgi:hypothetical protein